MKLRKSLVKPVTQQNISSCSVLSPEIVMHDAFNVILWTSADICVYILACAKSHMLSASRRQPHLLHVSAVDRRQTWSMDKSWRCVTLSGFLYNHIVRCRWNPISCGTHYSAPDLSKNDSAVTTDVCEDQNREVGLWGLPLKWNWPP